MHTSASVFIQARYVEEGVRTDTHLLLDASLGPAPADRCKLVVQVRLIHRNLAGAAVVPANGADAALQVLEVHFEPDGVQSVRVVVRLGCGERRAREHLGVTHVEEWSGVGLKVDVDVDVDGGGGVYEREGRDGDVKRAQGGGICI